MLYGIIGICIAILALLGFKERLKRRSRSRHNGEEAMKKASCAVAIGQWAEAEQELIPLLHARHPLPLAHLLHIQVLRGTKRLDEALTAVDHALIDYPKDLPLHLERGRLLCEAGRPDEAVVSLRIARPILRQEEEVTLLATALFAVGETEEAWQVLGDRPLNSVYGPLLSFAGDYHFYQGRYEEALHYYQRAKDNEWSDYHVLCHMGQCHQEMGNIQEAKNHFKEILDHDTSDITATVGMGLCLEKEGDVLGAMRIYQQGRAWERGDPGILERAGICAIHLEQPVYATLYLREALQRGGPSPSVLAALASALGAMEEWGEAEEMYQRLAAHYPGSVVGVRSLAWLYGVGLSTSLSDATGLAYAYRAVELQPDTISWEILSACEARVGNFNKAHSIQECLASHDTDTAARRRHQLAMRSLRKGLPLNNEHLSRLIIS